MTNNKLKDKGAISILNNLTEYILTMNFSWNHQMGVPAYEVLGSKINSIFYRLKKLSLDHNNIS